MSDEIEVDSTMLEIPLDRFSGFDLALFLGLCEQGAGRHDIADEWPARYALGQIAAAENYRDQNTPPRRYFGLYLTQWSTLHLVAGARLFNRLATLEGISEPAGRLLDDLLTRCLAHLHGRIEEQPA